MFRASCESRVAEDAARAAREAHGVNGATPPLVRQGHIPVGQPLRHAGQALGAGPADTTIREPSKFSRIKMRSREIWDSIKMKFKKIFDFSWTRRTCLTFPGREENCIQVSLANFSRLWRNVPESEYHNPYVPLHQEHPNGPPTQMHGHPSASPGDAVSYVETSPSNLIERPGEQVNEGLSESLVAKWLPRRYFTAAEGLPKYFRTNGYIVQDENKLFRVLAQIGNKDQNSYQLVRKQINESRHYLGESMVQTTENGREMSRLTDHLFGNGVHGGLEDIAAFAEIKECKIAVVYQEGGISHAQYFGHPSISRDNVYGIIMKDGDFQLLVSTISLRSQRLTSLQ
ncbi:hypothetical protein MJO28_000778 [Puccinia striiformis f. sp. tritici]|uniref:Uncharacterized protein n=1 Tax=Puccinia striiformis f. sp. tritici TaxID=168172 RepID=A0ACC0EY59_9BASI|nr:hypothetical protein MJO28_000778 [Puccinia striiformis f. sp. tritici]